MIKRKRVIGVITARGNSKGLPGKNLRPVGGKPLVVWTIEAGLASKYLDRLILSSDDDAIIEVAKRSGCDAPFKREAALGADDTPSIDVVVDALERCPGYDWVVLLQPTSPLRTGQDIDKAIERCVESGAPACVSVCEAEQSPYWMRTIKEDGRLSPLLPPIGATRRQDLPRIFILNGAVYLARTAWLLQMRDFNSPETVAYQMPADRSLDIDTEFDMRRLEVIVEGR